MDCFFDATTVDPLESGFTPIPDGEYEVVITKSQNKPTKAGTGSYLELQMQVVSGEYAKRTLWQRLNLKNPNPVAVEMAKRELSSICHATGVLRPKSKEELHGIPVIVRVASADDGRGGTSNVIKGWKAKEVAAKQETPPSSEPVSAGDRPW
jgi:hypothetical protein